MRKYVLALDEGTTSARAILFDRQSNIVSMAQHEFPQKYPRPGWVEQDPMDIYANQYAALTECIAKSGVDADEIAAIGITNQRETVIAWSKATGRPIYNAIVWQCRRTTDICRELEKAGHAQYIKSVTGLRIDPYFSGTKIKWILDNVEGARQMASSGELLVGTVDTWLIWKLTEGRVFVTDLTNASRTMLCNIHTGQWDQKILDILDIPSCVLPEIKSSSEIYGYFECMGADIPISGIAGDQQAALFGQGCFCAGEAKNTYGTGCFLLAHTGEEAVSSKNGLLTTIAACEKNMPIQYALEGSVFVGGVLSILFLLQHTLPYFFLHSYVYFNKSEISTSKITEISYIVFTSLIPCAIHLLTVTGSTFIPSLANFSWVLYLDFLIKIFKFLPTFSAKVCFSIFHYISPY